MCKVQTRNLGLDALRIFSIIIIVFHHWSVHSGIDFYTDMNVLKNTVVQLLGCGGQIGVNCFVMITGYFLVDKEFRIQRIVKLWLEILFYSIFIMLIAYTINMRVSNWAIFIKSFMPITFNMYWFMSSYVLLSLLSPFINSFINLTSKREYALLLTILIFTEIVIPTMFDIIGNTAFTNEILWFMTLYLIGAAIKKYNIGSWMKGKRKYIVIAVSLTLMAVWILGISVLYVKGNSTIRNFIIFKELLTYFYHRSRIFVVVISFALFIIFEEMKITQNTAICKIIEFLSPTVFAVYLIHENIAFRYVLWQKIFAMTKQWYSILSIPLLILYGFACTISVIAVSVLIEKLRKKIIGKQTELISQKISTKLDTFMNRLKPEEMQ